MKQLDAKFDQLWHTLGSVNSQPQGKIAQALDHLEKYIKQVWENTPQHSAAREILTLMYIRQLCRTGLQQGFMVADPNQDGIPELFWLNNGELWVLSPVGGTLKYWVNLNTGQVRTSSIDNQLHTGTPQLRGALHDQLTAQAEPLIPANTHYSYMFRHQVLTFQYKGPRLHLTKKFQYQPDNRQFEISYTCSNPTETTLILDFQIHNNWTLDALSLWATNQPAFNWQMSQPQTYLLQAAHTPWVIFTQAQWAEKWCCQSNASGCEINPEAIITLLPAKNQTLEMQLKSDTNR